MSLRANADLRIFERAQWRCEMPDPDTGRRCEAVNGHANPITGGTVILSVLRIDQNGRECLAACQACLARHMPAPIVVTSPAPAPRRMPRRVPGQLTKAQKEARTAAVCALWGLPAGKVRHV